MPEFSIRSDSVDVEQIMRQIRARISEKRGVDYTEEEIRQLASVKLEKFLDPLRVRSDLLERLPAPAQLGRARVAARRPRTTRSTTDTIYGSSRGAAGRILRSIRKLLNPLLKLFINPNPMIHVLHMQSDQRAHQRRSIAQRAFDRTLDALNYEVLQQPRVELTRLEHRGQEPEDAGRVADAPARLQRAARARARGRGAVQARAALAGCR